MDAVTARRLARMVRRAGCGSVHIGGGEPFLDVAKLGEVLDALAEEGLGVEYVETNGFWAVDGERAEAVLGALEGRGVRALLVSFSPFHNAFVPLERMENAVRACRRRGWEAIPWTEAMWREMGELDRGGPHGMAEYEERFGEGYGAALAWRYPLRLGGRAALTFAGVLEGTEADALCEAAGPCREPQDTTHFHVDLEGNYVPGLCAGFVVDVEDAVAGEVDGERYPWLAVVVAEGVAGLRRLAERCGVRVGGRFVSKCHLCLEIRRRLVASGCGGRELGPKGFYEALEVPCQRGGR